MKKPIPSGIDSRSYGRLSERPTASVRTGLNKFSRRVTQPKQQGASQAMLYGAKLEEDDMNRPQVGPCARDPALLRG